MPNQLEAFRIGEQANINNRKLLLAMLISLAVGIPVSFLMTFSLLYNHGAARAPGFLGSIGWETFNRLQNWLNYPATNDYAAMSAMGIGFGFTMFLSAMKMRFIWWPFHPIGYVIGTGVWGDMSFIWFPVLVSWVIKFAILRYGGLQAYRKAIPFFAGLILGDYIVGGAWSIIGMAFSIPTYNIWLS